ncbi:MAG: class I SAM-dependent methyltransferase [Nitrospiria bacterium]
MIFEKEAFSPLTENLSLIHQIAESFAPEDENLKEWFKFFSQNHCERIAFDLELVNKYATKKDKILEFGSFPLLLTIALKKCGNNIIGLDIDPCRLTAVIKKHSLEVIQCNFEIDNVPFRDDEFKVIIFNEIFEHLRINPVFTLKEVYRVLEPGGVLLFSTPNLRSLKGIWNYVFNNIANSCSMDIYSEYQKLETIGHVGHVREYTSREIHDFLLKIGFCPTKIIWRGKYYGISKVIVYFFPFLRPFFSIIAVKPKFNSNE